MNKALLHFLSLLFGVQLLILTFFLGRHVYSNLFWDTAYSEIEIGANGASQTKTGSLYKEDGYPMPVRFSISMPDTILTYVAARRSATDSSRWVEQALDHRIFDGNPVSDIFPLLEHFDTIRRIDTTTLCMLTDSHKAPAHDTTYYGELPFDFYYQYRSRSSPFKEISMNAQSMRHDVLVHPKAASLKMKLVLRDIGMQLLLVLITYQLLRTTLLLGGGLSFSLNLTRRLRFIGLLVLAYSIGVYLLELDIARTFDHSSLMVSSTIHNKTSMINMHLYPSARFSWTYLYIGVLLLILSQLFQRSEQIEKEISLTV